MQPSQQPYVPVPPEQISYTPEQQAAIRRSNKLKLTWGLICLIAPTALIIFSIIIYAIFNFVFSSLDSSSGGSYGSTSDTIVNVLLFLMSSLAVLTWLPGIIVGIILLATRKSV